LIGHNKKRGCRGSVTEEIVGINKFERPTIVATKGQPIGCSYHIIYVDKIIEIGRHKEKGLRVGNQKFQLLE
jgi:hypothetical protein